MAAVDAVSDCEPLTRFQRINVLNTIPDRSDEADRRAASANAVGTLSFHPSFSPRRHADDNSFTRLQLVIQPANRHRRRLCPCQSMPAQGETERYCLHPYKAIWTQDGVGS